RAESRQAGEEGREAAPPRGRDREAEGRARRSWRHGRQARQRLRRGPATARRSHRLLLALASRQRLDEAEARGEFGRSRFQLRGNRTVGVQIERIAVADQADYR